MTVARLLLVVVLFFGAALCMYEMNRNDNKVDFTKSISNAIGGVGTKHRPSKGVDPHAFGGQKVSPELASPWGGVSSIDLDRQAAEAKAKDQQNKMNQMRLLEIEKLLDGESLSAQDRQLLDEEWVVLTYGQLDLPPPARDDMLHLSYPKPVCTHLESGDAVVAGVEGPGVLNILTQMSPDTVIQPSEEQWCKQ